VLRSKNKKEDHSIQSVAASRPPALRATSSPTAAPTVGPTAPTKGPTSEPSLSARGAAMELIHNTLYLLSGDALWDESTPQHAAYDWLINSDDGGNPIDTLPIDIITERYVMALFFLGMNGEAWPMRFGFLSGVSVCDWNDDASGLGVFCDDSSGKVNEIALSEYYLCLKNVKFGQWRSHLTLYMPLFIDSNNVEGTLPDELGALSALQVLELRYNGISGTIPSSIGQLSKLASLDLRQNKLTGDIPEAVFTLPYLEKLFLFLNDNLGGTIPPSIKSATNLQFISFQRCSLRGQVKFSNFLVWLF
jgi:Leucine rich repeat